MDAEENQHQVSLRAHSLCKSLRDSHIPAGATSSGKVETQNQRSHFPTATVVLTRSETQNKEASSASSAPHFQAHSSIRKCFGFQQARFPVCTRYEEGHDKVGVIESIF